MSPIIHRVRVRRPLPSHRPYLASGSPVFFFDLGMASGRDGGDLI
jgi:hypothetical protein